eukprot:8262989-Pyramimonas_sp.AAC.1
MTTRHGTDSRRRCSRLEVCASWDAKRDATSRELDDSASADSSRGSTCGKRVTFPWNVSVTPEGDRRVTRRRAGG